MVANLTTKDFLEKFLNKETNTIEYYGGKPLIIDFYADWCGPCKIAKPVFEEISNQYNNVDFFKVNVDEESDIAQYFGIRSIPTFIFLKNENEIKQYLGVLPKERFYEIIKEFFEIMQ